MTVADMDKPSVVVVTEEFVTIGKQVATIKGHPQLPQLVLPYPLETRPEPECREIARQFYPRLLELLGAQA